MSIATNLGEPMQNTVLSQADSRSEMTDRWLELLGYINRELHTGSIDEWREMDLTLLQIKSLVLLDHQGDMRMGNISQFLGSTVSATTSIVERLFDKGMVTRDSDPKDRRVVVIQLTPEGKRVVDLWRIGNSRVGSVADHLTDEQLETVVTAFGILGESLESMNRGGNQAPMAE